MNERAYDVTGKTLPRNWFLCWSVDEWTGKEIYYLSHNLDVITFWLKSLHFFRWWQIWFLHGAFGDFTASQLSWSLVAAAAFYEHVRGNVAHHRVDSVSAPRRFSLHCFNLPHQGWERQARLAIACRRRWHPHGLSGPMLCGMVPTMVCGSPSFGVVTCL